MLNVNSDIQSMRSGAVPLRLLQVLINLEGLPRWIYSWLNPLPHQQVGQKVPLYQRHRQATH